MEAHVRQKVALASRESDAFPYPFIEAGSPHSQRETLETLQEMGSFQHCELAGRRGLLIYNNQLVFNGQEEEEEEGMAAPRRAGDSAICRGRGASSAPGHGRASARARPRHRTKRTRKNKKTTPNLSLTHPRAPPPPPIIFLPSSQAKAPRPPGLQSGGPAPARAAPRGTAGPGWASRVPSVTPRCPRRCRRSCRRHQTCCSRITWALLGPPLGTVGPSLGGCWALTWGLLGPHLGAVGPSLG